MNKIEKKNYLIILNEQLEVFNKKVVSFKRKIESENFPKVTEAKRKYQRLKNSMDRFSWKINHFKESENVVDDLVMESFNDIIDEVSLRLEEVELALGGKQLWQAGEDYNRNKWKIKDLQAQADR
ncbi:MAG: hypothetical protein P8Z35_00470 [Ignavibacteriaceae bacterium]|jgi:hypothetical protein